MTELEEKAYYTPEETAHYLDVDPDMIRELCRKGQIPGARKVGKFWRIPRKYLVPDEATNKDTRTDE